MSMNFSNASSAEKDNSSSTESTEENESLWGQVGKFAVQTGAKNMLKKIFGRVRGGVLSDFVDPNAAGSPDDMFYYKEEYKKHPELYGKDE